MEVPVQQTREAQERILACVREITHPSGSRFRALRHIGSGAYGIVIAAVDCINADRKAVAIKALDKEPILLRHPEYVRRETVNHCHLSTGHEHVVQLHEVFITENYVCLVMELATGGDLSGFIRAVARRENKDMKLLHQREDWAKWFLQQYVLALDYCHHRGVANRDIKLQNTLLNVSFEKYLETGIWPLIKMSDFGFSKSESDTLPDTACGTLLYMAPEVIAGGEYDGVKADMWSLGVLLYSLLYHRFPFDNPNDRQSQNGRDLIRDLIRQCPSPFIPKDSQQLLTHMHIYKTMDDGQTAIRDVGLDAINLLNGLLVPDPNKRLTLEQVMNHPWVTECRWVDMGRARSFNQQYYERPSRSLQPEAVLENMLHAAHKEIQERVARRQEQATYVDQHVDNLMNQRSQVSEPTSEVFLEA